MAVSLADRLTDVMLGMTRPQADWFEALYVAALDTVGDPHAALERAKVAWLDNPAPNVRQPIDLAYDVGRRSLDLAEAEPSDASATLLAIIQAIIEAKESGDEDSLEDLIDQIMGHADDSVDLAWTSQQTKTGKVKAVGSAEHAGRVLYGDAALRALQKQEAKQDPNNASKQAAEKPKGKRALSAEAAEAAGTLSREIIAAGRATPEQVEQLAQHLPSLTVDQLKGLAKVMGEKVGVRKAEIAERLLAKAKASLQAAGDGEQVPAVKAPAATAQPLGRLGDLMIKGHDKLTDDERQEAVAHAKSLLPFLQSLGVIPGDATIEKATSPIRPVTEVTSKLTLSSRDGKTPSHVYEPGDITIVNGEKHTVTKASKPLFQRGYRDGNEQVGANKHTQDVTSRPSTERELLQDELKRLQRQHGTYSMSSDSILDFSKQIDEIKNRLSVMPAMQAASPISAEQPTAATSQSTTKPPHEMTRMEHAEGPKSRGMSVAYVIPASAQSYAMRDELKKAGAVWDATAKTWTIDAKDKHKTLAQRASNGSLKRGWINWANGEREPHHSELVEQALQRGDDVPDAVRAEYPDLDAKYPKDSKPAPTPPPTSTDPGEYTGDPTLIVPHARHEQRRREALPPATPDQIKAALAAVQQHAEANPLLGGLGKYPEAYDAAKDSGVFRSPQHFMRAISDAIDQGLLEFRANNDPGFEQRNRPDLGVFALPHRTDDLAGVSTWGRLTPQGAAMARKTK